MEFMPLIAGLAAALALALLCQRPTTITASREDERDDATTRGREQHASS